MLLHKPHPSEQQSTLQATETAPAPSDNPSVSTLMATLKNKMSVLCTFKAVLEVDGCVQAVRGILDSGSTLSILTFRVANSLKAKKIANAFDVSGINDSQSATCKHRTEIILSSSELPDEEPIHLSPALLSSITANTPSVDLSTPSATLAFSSLKLADPDLGKPGRIDLLLGLDVMSKIGKPGWISAKDTNLFGYHTIFGWVVGGTCANS